jgi:hypothetical protein
MSERERFVPVGSWCAVNLPRAAMLARAAQIATRALGQSGPERRRAA